MGEKLYNNIELPEVWPPVDVDIDSTYPRPVPYLQNPPEVININVGRQLFIDDFLVGGDVAWANNMRRTYHTPVKYPGNPIFFGQTDDELRSEYPPCAIAKSGGVWWDGYDQIFKMWYMSGYLGYASYAISTDGIHWERPQLDVVSGTNHILSRDIHPDSGSVIIDYFTDNENERYKMMVREPNPIRESRIPALLYASRDGIHWNEPRKTDLMEDRSTMFYNSFRKKWVQSIRISNNKAGRFRAYYEDDNFYDSGKWRDLEKTACWLRADELDEQLWGIPQIYNLDAIPYESLIIGFPQILKGPPNYIGERTGTPKISDLTVAYTRDGFNWHRPVRTPFIGSEATPGSWEYGYIDSSAGMCLIVGDELWIYYSAYAGDNSRTSANTKNWYYNGMYANGAVGIAKLRRDGFASMDACLLDSILETKLVEFSGSHLFVNANTAGACLKAEVLGEDNQVLKGLSADDCVGFIGNSTKAEIKWKEFSLASVAGKPVRFRFKTDRGQLFSFWVSQSEDGESGGYVGAGGPGFSGPQDL